MTSYLTFEDYQKMGGTLPLVEFENMEFTARAKIDYVTQKRISQGISDDTWERVKRLIVRLIETQLLGNVSGRRRSSESSGKVSVSFVDDNGSNGRSNAENLIREYLAGEVNDKGIPLINPSIMTARVLKA